MINLMEEDEEEKHSHGHHISRKLNFNAPLLTTRRSPVKLSDTAANVLPTTSDRVPFSWEQAPGMPKETAHDGATTPRPTLPPGWWRPHHNDDGSSGGSDAVEVFSLSEALDHMVESAEKDHKFSDELKLRQLRYEEEGRKYCNPSLNFMMERFLPDATALAASSAVSHREYSCSYSDRGCISPQKVAAAPFSPPKGCGLDVLFPWRVRQHRLCGVKSPVRHGSVSLGAKSCVKRKKELH